MSTKVGNTKYFPLFSWRVIDHFFEFWVLTSISSVRILRMKSKYKNNASKINLASYFIFFANTTMFTPCFRFGLKKKNWSLFFSFSRWVTTPREHIRSSVLRDANARGRNPTIAAGEGIFFFFFSFPFFLCCLKAEPFLGLVAAAASIRRQHGREGREAPRGDVRRWQSYKCC